MSLPSFDAITGVLLLGSWINSVLYTVELIQVSYYFGHFQQDNWQMKVLVAAAFLLDTVSVLSNYAIVYVCTITHAGDVMFYLTKRIFVKVAALISLTSLVAILIQSFQVLRYWRISKNIIVTVFICFLNIVAFGAALADAVMVGMFELGKLQNFGIPWLVTGTTADICIAVALLWEIKKASPVQKETQSLFNRMVTTTIQTGTATATIALTALFVSFLKPGNTAPLALLCCLGRVYVLSMLSNLNIRTSCVAGESASSGEPQSAPDAREAEQGALHFTTVGATDDTSGPYANRTGRTSTPYLRSAQNTPATSSKSNPSEMFANGSPAHHSS
ncbi:hypothetical protein GGX14DRAFT_15608 [Mycena pura]|uniref:DUF6534 domain-containing protein n=1 Tax=Mycena pura TaxID=153505 RepID=A0AAD6UWH0_9AGAR|nr:hypothetical protein GGX14DRAFT_15608 [Mycena pura]